MFGRIAKLAVLMAALSAALLASTIQFGLLGDPDQSYTFTRTDTPVANSEYPYAQVTVPAGPYPGYLGANVPADQYLFFCLNFLKTATFGASYLGSLTPPGTPQQLEAAYLAAEMASVGGAKASLQSYKGPLSMAIWQIMDPTAGDVPRDPAAQPYVTAATEAYDRGILSPADFPNTWVFVPNDSKIQSFMTVAPSTPPFQQLSQEEGGLGVPEPASILLIGGGLLLIGLGAARFKTRAPAPGRQ